MLQVIGLYTLVGFLAFLMFTAPTEAKIKENDTDQINFWKKVLPSEGEECNVFLHEGVLDVLDKKDMPVVLTTKVCVFKADSHFLLKLKNNKQKDILIIAHGHVSLFGEETMANVFKYRHFRNLAKSTGKRITVLSCRGDKSKKAIAYVRDITPHLEDGLWVYGRKGYKIAAEIGDQIQGWRAVMQNES